MSSTACRATWVSCANAHSAVVHNGSKLPEPLGEDLQTRARRGLHQAWTVRHVVPRDRRRDCDRHRGRGLLAGPARRAGHLTLGIFTESESFPVSWAFLWVDLGLALHDVDWTTLARQCLAFLVVYTACRVWRTLRHRRNNA
jgi:hypothetical protein